MDNASNHSVKMIKAPTMKTNKAVIQGHPLGMARGGTCPSPGFSVLIIHVYNYYTIIYIIIIYIDTDLSLWYKKNTSNDFNMIVESLIILSSILL